MRSSRSTRSSREIRFANGSVGAYAGLISSMPLPELDPRHRRHAAGRPRGGRPPRLLGGGHRQPGGRPGRPHRRALDLLLRPGHLLRPDQHPSPAVAAQRATRLRQPPGGVLLLARSTGRSTGTPDECIEPVIGDLRESACCARRTGSCSRTRCTSVRERDLRPRARRRACRRSTATWTRSASPTAGATATGRYIWTDESFLSGERAAQKVLNGIRNGD